MGDTPNDGVGTLVVGVDALSQEVLDHLPSGSTSTIDEIVSNGASGPLESQLPPWTPSAWPSLYTGVNPGKHGVFGFLRYDGYDWDVVDATDVREHAIWELLSMEGYRSVVVNVPVTGPPAEFEGALIPGYISPADPTCHPAGLLSEVRDELGEYRLYNKQLNEGATREERINGYEEVTRMRGEALRYLVEREDPEFAFVQFQQTDTVLHEYPDDEEATSRVYRAVDDEIARTIEECDPDTVVIVSDHGIGPVDDVEFRPNTFLRDAGYLETTAGGEKPSWSQLSKEKIRGTAEPDDSEPELAERALSAAAGVGLTSQRIGRVLKTLRLDGIALRVVPNDLVRAGSEHVDFPASTAYMRDRIELGIRINKQGREPEGTVSAGAYERVRSEIIEEFSELTLPDGSPVFDDVLRREDVYSGPYVENAPDIVLVPANFDVFLSATVLDEPFGAARESWSHKLQGIVAIHGDDVPTANLRGAHLLDVAPTLLSLVGAPVSDRIDGSAVPVVEETERVSVPPYDPDGAPDRQEDDGAVKKRLSGFGYIE